jgi:hypothetical protein
MASPTLVPLPFTPVNATRASQLIRLHVIAWSFDFDPRRMPNHAEAREQKASAQQTFHPPGLVRKVLYQTAATGGDGANPEKLFAAGYGLLLWRHEIPCFARRPEGAKRRDSSRGETPLDYPPDTDP